jgi:hypothetical protein
MQLVEVLSFRQTAFRKGLFQHLNIKCRVTKHNNDSFYLFSAVRGGHWLCFSKKLEEK